MLGVDDELVVVTAAAAAAAANNEAHGLLLTMEFGEEISGDDASEPLNDALLVGKIACGRGKWPPVEKGARGKRVDIKGA